jgi:hypothetical protein
MKPKSKICLPTVQENRRILAGAKSDPDAQPLTPNQLRLMVPIATFIHLKHKQFAKEF